MILGGGIGGLSTAFSLGAEEGVRVTLIEREPRHHEHSSGRSAEILRTGIDDPVTEELGLLTSDLLRAPSTVGLKPFGPLVDGRGLVVITEASSEDPWIQRHLDRGAARAMPLDELREVAPHFSPIGTEAYLLPGGGRIDVAQLMSALARGASARGVRFLRSAGTATPYVHQGRVAGVEVRGQRVPCDELIVAAGAWSGPIGEALGAPLPLRTTRRHMWVTGADPTARVHSPIVWDDVAGFYARPEATPEGSGTGWAFSATDLDDYSLARAAVDSAGAGDSADAGARQMYAIDARERDLALEAARIHLPSAGHNLVRAWRGIRDLAPDDRPILGPDARVPGLVWCAGLCGHGMTISLAIGMATTDAIMGRRNVLLERCSAQRFEPAVQ